MKSKYLLVIAISLIFDLGIKTNSTIAAVQPDSQESINVQLNTPLPPLRVDSPSRTVTTEELFRKQQNQWQKQQDLWQQKQIIRQRQLNMKFQQQDRQQQRAIQQQQELKIRGK